ncbi:MAG TPA: polysaccharide biosynthesis tyrosine autokinase [Flavitalea sp.]|nr:polysaccharide biosynthesis tyrosine autokinase [Flavitalea sp.]
MQNNLPSKQKAESNVIDNILFRYLPYWPLFVTLLIFGGACAWLYLNYATPLYQATATLMVNDEKKGVDDSKLLEALNIYTSKKIVENEIEVLRSRAIMNEVVNELNLYAPVMEDGDLKSVSAYTSSPIVIEVKDSDHLEEVENVYFTMKGKKEVTIAGKSYPMNTWVETPYGLLQFKKNKRKSRSANSPLYFNLIEQKTIANDYLSNLQVSAASKLSTVINLSIKDEVRKRGEDILDEILDIYNKFSIREKNKLAANTLSFVKGRLQLVEAELDSMQRIIQQYKSDKKVTDLSEQGRLYLKSVGENDRRSSEIDMQLAVLQQVENYVISKNNKSGIVPSTLGVNDPVLSDLLAKLRDAEMKFDILRKSSAENNPAVLSLANQIENIRPGILENIRNQKNSLLASQRELSNTTVHYNTMLQSIPQKERELLDINRQQIIKSDVYTFLLHKREETALSYASTVADSWVIDNAEASKLPVSPNKMIIYLLSFVMAMIAAVAIVTGKEVFNRKVLFRSEIEAATKVPVVAEILSTRGKQEFLMTPDKASPNLEQFRQLRAAIGMYGKVSHVKKLLVTSSISGEGKSYVCANLALSLAFSGKKVLLIDLDLRNPMISSNMGVLDSEGLSEYLEGQRNVEEIIQNVNNKNLFMISAGGNVVNPTELLLTGNLSGFFEKVEKIFDFIIIDTAPIGSVIDAYVLSEFCDTTLFVIRHDYTPKTLVNLIDENNKIKALRNVSIVFNGVRSRGILKGNYGYGFGYGYEYVYKERTRIEQKKKMSAKS